ncbi:MAG: protease modulator HflC [Thermoanaerobaculales bacterium]|jgi:membrane protease subunit HflC|nr:protease modulator HflC [Thermoanaerobaculales bacterium]
MKQASLIVVVAFVALVVVTVGGAFFIVNEAEQVIITQFGKPVGDPITSPGLKVKVPFLQKANYFDKRFLEWDGAANEVPTKDKRFLYVDTYARWRISDPLLFFQRLRDERGAQSRLDDILDGETRNTVANYELIEVVRTTNRDFVVSSAFEDAAVKQISAGRAKLEQEILTNASTRTQVLGIEILDFQFKRTNYAEVDRPKVYERMISERKRIAEEYRSEGAGEAARIAGAQDRDLKEISSEAYRQAQEIRGKADAEAADIYARAYNKDPDFYRFLKTMEVYRKTLDKGTILMLSTEGEFLEYLERAR